MNNFLFLNIFIIMFFTTIVHMSPIDPFTPNQANWKTFQSIPLAVGNTGHDPDSVTWITKTQWDGKMITEYLSKIARF